MRELVRGMCSDWSVSIRTACGALRFDRSSFHYRSRRTDQAAVERRIREICETRVRYGYRRVHVLLRREGWEINMKKTHRIYNELGLQLRNKHPKRRVKAKLREDRQEAAGPNEVWAMDFVHDQLATGRKLRILTIVDTHSRFCPAADPRFAYRGEDVVQTLERVCPLIGYPQDDPGRQRQRVHLPRPRPVGLCQRRHLGLLPARKAHRQRLHRGLQQQASGRVPERALVPDACRCPRKAGELAQRLQRGPTAQRDRIQRPDRHP